MGRRRRAIPGVSFSWKRATGITSAKRRASRATGVSFTGSGRQRKAGGCLFTALVILAAILGLIHIKKNPAGAG